MSKTLVSRFLTLAATHGAYSFQPYKVHDGEEITPVHTQAEAVREACAVDEASVYLTAAQSYGYVRVFMVIGEGPEGVLTDYAFSHQLDERAREAWEAIAKAWASSC